MTTTTDLFSDTLSRFVFERAAVRGALVCLDATCRDVLGAHEYPPPLARVLAELMAAATLLASTLKLNGSLILQLRGDGPVSLLVVECDATFALRATAQWNDDVALLADDAPLATLAGGASQAILTITLDPKDGGPLYQGIVGLRPSSIAELIEHYLGTSEQIDSRLVLAASQTRSRGLLVQRMPGATSAEDATWARVAAEAGAVQPPDLLSAVDPASFLTSHFPNDELRLFAPKPARYFCGCSEARIGNALRLIGREEVESILREQGMIGVTCEFCNRRYTFAPEDARALFDAGSVTREGADDVVTSDGCRR